MSDLSGVSDDALLTRHAHYTARIREAQAALDAVNDEWTRRHASAPCPEHCREPQAPLAPADGPGLTFVVHGTEANHLRALLSCGHWSGDIFDRSSQWDFPDDPLTCPEGCG